MIATFARRRVVTGRAEREWRGTEVTGGRTAIARRLEGMRSSLARFHCEIGLGDGAEARARVTRASATRRQKRRRRRMASRLDDAPLRADHRRMVIATTSARVEAWRTSRPVAMSHSLDGVWNLRACPQKRISCLHQTNPKQPTLPWRMVRRSFREQHTGVTRGNTTAPVGWRRSARFVAGQHTNWSWQNYLEPTA